MTATSRDGLPTSALLRLAEEEVDRLRHQNAEMEKLIRLVAESKGELADAAREVLR